MRNFALPLAVQSLAALLLLSVAGCATNPVTGQQNLVLISEQQEIALGRKHHALLLQQYSVYADRELQNYVNRLGQKLAKNSHRKHLRFTFTVLDSPEVNAFALPGGYVYITRGIIAYMNSEAELAGVLGHEIGHVTARHSVRQQTAQTGAGLLQTGIGILTGSSSIARTAGQFTHAWTSGYGRRHELEADRLGAEYLARVGYAPEKMLDVIGLLKDQEAFDMQRARREGRKARKYHGVYATHPRNDQRLQEVIRAARKFANPNPVQTDPEKFLRLLDGMPFGHSEHSGIVQGPHFYHKRLDFALQFPSGWRIENQPGRLIAVRADNQATLLVQLGEATGPETPEQYLRRRAGGLFQGRALSPTRYTGLIRGRTAYGERPIAVATVFHSGRAWVISGFGRADLPTREFYSTVNSIRRLNSQERALATGKKLRIVRAKPGDSIASLAGQTGVGQYAEEQLRLLNELYPNGEPQAGQLIKTIQ